MAITSKGLDRSRVISLGGVNVPLVSQGIDNVHIHPNVGLSVNAVELADINDTFDVIVSYTAGSTGFDLEYMLTSEPCDSEGEFICDSSGNNICSIEMHATSPYTTVTFGAEQSIGLSRVQRTLTITRTAVTPSTTTEKIIINFDNYMAQADITITQTAPAALNSISMTGGGITGTATDTNTSSSNRNQIVPQSSAGVAVLTVNGEVGATYTLGENGDIFTSVDKTTVFTIPSGGSATHNVLVAAAGGSSRNGGFFVDNDITGARLQIYFTQPADNVPVLSITNQNLTDPIQGETVTATVNITNADPADGTLSVLTPSATILVNETLNVAGDGTATYALSIPSPETGIYNFQFTDSDGNAGTTTLELTVTALSLSGDLFNLNWNTTSQTLVWNINGFSSAQRNRVSSSNFVVTQFSPSSPSRGSVGSVTYTASLGRFSAALTAIPPFNSLAGTETTTWRGTLTVGTASALQNTLIDKTARPENPVTFPNGNPTISDTDTSVTFAVRYDSLTPNIALTDASTTDTDIWTDSELSNSSLGAATNPNVSSDINVQDFYLLQREVTISGGDANTSVSTLMDLIRVTSSA